MPELVGNLVYIIAQPESVCKVSIKCVGAKCKQRRANCTKLEHQELCLPHSSCMCVSYQHGGTRHKTIQQTPFFLNHGRSPKTPLYILSCLIGPCLITRFLTGLQRDFNSWLQRPGSLLWQLSIRHKRYCDVKHAPAVFAVDDEVLLSSSGLNLKFAGSDKLAPCFVWPLNVLEHIG